MKHSSFLIAALLVTGCYKPTLNQEANTAFTIKGRLLESRSNPVPVIGYSLNLGQSSSIGPLGLIADIDSVKHTDSAGKFTFTYKDYKQYAVFFVN